MLYQRCCPLHQKFESHLPLSRHLIDSSLQLDVVNIRHIALIDGGDGHDEIGLNGATTQRIVAEGKNWHVAWIGGGATPNRPLTLLHHLR